MAVRDQTRKPKAILFGYSCHSTALSGYKVNGDYAGYAQAEIEKANLGAIALFVMGCGGDANPLPRIMNSTEPEAVDLAAMYGRILAAAVKNVLAGPMQPVGGPLKAKYGIATIPFQKPPTKAELLERGKYSKRHPGSLQRLPFSAIRKRRQAARQLPLSSTRLDVFGKDLLFIGLTGESVVDYCLRFKREYGVDNTWVAGYHNELLSYIPSLRVLKEGGYEGTEGVYEYGLPGPYGHAVEEVIAEKVQELVREAKAELGPAK